MGEACLPDTFYLHMKILSCVEGDRSNYLTEADSTAQSLRLRAVVVFEGLESDLSP